jgi:hypothetical protein
VSEDAADLFAKAGVMVRNGLTADAAFIILDIKPDGGLEFMARGSDGDCVMCLGGASVGFDAWLKLDRAGSTITASYSHDGSTWTPVGSTALALSTPPLAGLAVTSHDPSRLNTAVVDNVTLRQ